MSQETSSNQTSEAYQAGYYHGFSGMRSCPEKFPGQESKYLEGHRKGWQDGYMNQRGSFLF